MMKKRKFGVKIILSLLVVLSFVTYTNVNAAEDNTKVETTIDCSGYTDENEKKQCEQKAKTCINELNKANYKLTTSLSDDQKNITYKIDQKKDITATYKVEINIILDNNVVKNEIFDNVEGGKKYTYSLPSVDKNKEYYVNIAATVNSTTNTDGMDCYQYFKGTSIFSIGNVTSEEFENPYITSDGVCTKYKNGNLYGKETYAFSKIKNATIKIEGKTMTGEQYFDQLLPYCSMSRIEYLIPEEQMKTQIKNAAQIVNSTSKMSNAQNIPLNIPDNYIEVKDATKKLNFYCDAFGSYDSNTHYYKSENNVRRFYHKESKPPVKAKYNDSYLDSNGRRVNETTVCEVECMEQVEATYGPPVAVKANICFEYEITVKSKSTCSAKFNPDVVVPKKTEYRLCNPIPVCNQASYLYRNQAGPNEEFDQCVMEIDGGKYKQSTINKCYNKVYKKKKSVKKQNASLALEYQPVQKIANSNMPNYCNKSNNFGGLSASSVAQAVYNMYTKEGYQGGYYEKEGSTIVWKSCNSNQSTCKQKGIKFIDGCYWNDYARYYTASSLSYTTRNVMDDVYFYQANNGSRWWDYRSTYYKPKDGFKTAYYGSNSNPCNDNCVYTTSNCSSTDALNPSDTVTAGENYEKDLVIYESAIDKCNQQIACTTDKVTKYTMSVNHSTGEIKVCDPSQKDGDNKNCKVWATTNAKNNPVSNIKDKILKNASGICYGDDGGTDKYQYINVISFPGSWIRNKDGSVRYGFTDGVNKKGYTKHENKYCISPKAGNVNDKWWTWDQLGGRLGDNLCYIGAGACTDSTRENLYRKTKDDLGEEYFKLINETNRSGKDKTNGYYNIFGSITDFGYFNWNLDFSCFYAVNNEPCTPGTPNCPPKEPPCTPGTPNCPSTNGLKNSDTRTIDLKDPFPAAETKGVSNKSKEEIIPKKLNTTTTEEKATKVADSSEGRTPGFNWSCDATNLSLKDYVIAPTALTLKMKNTDTYTADELDYKIELSTFNIKQIREYNKEEQNDYFSFNGKTEAVTYKDKNDSSKEHKINFYKSNLLSQNVYVTSISRPKGGNCNNYHNGSCDNLENWIEKAKGACPKLGEV